MHAIAHGVCADTVRESALKVESGRKKNPLLHRGLEPASVLRLAFQPDALPAQSQSILSSGQQSAKTDRNNIKDNDDFDNEDDNDINNNNEEEEEETEEE